MKSHWEAYAAARTNGSFETYAAARREIYGSFSDAVAWSLADYHSVKGTHQAREASFRLFEGRVKNLRELRDFLLKEAEDELIRDAGDAGRSYLESFGADAAAIPA